MSLSSEQMRICQERFDEVNTCRLGCGNCCPKTCLEFNHTTKLCKAHPTILGENESFKKRGHLCFYYPHDVFASGRYCPPIAEFFKEILDITIEPVLVENGVVSYKNVDEVFDATADFLAFFHYLKLVRDTR